MLGRIVGKTQTGARRARAADECRVRAMKSVQIIADRDNNRDLRARHFRRRRRQRAARAISAKVAASSALDPELRWIRA